MKSTKGLWFSKPKIPFMPLHSSMILHVSSSSFELFIILGNPDRAA